MRARRKSNAIDTNYFTTFLQTADMILAFSNSFRSKLERKVEERVDLMGNYPSSLLLTQNFFNFITNASMLFLGKRKHHQNPSTFLPMYNFKLPII